jgi:PKD repeat protein
MSLMRNRCHGWLALFFALGTLPLAAQSVYNGGRCGGAYNLVAGQSAVFVPGTNPAPDSLWLFVNAGQGNAIITDGAGGQTDGLFLHTGDVLLLQPAPQHTLYFQGGYVQVYFGGTVLNRPAAPVCGTGALGPLLLKTNRVLNLMTQSHAAGPPQTTVYAFQGYTTKTSGNITYTLVTNPSQLGKFTPEACSGSGCCQPQETNWALKNLSGGPFTLYLLDTGGFNLDWNTAVPAPLSCAATASTASGTAPLSVSFSATANNGSFGYQWKWSFGDGSSSVEQRPVHVYKNGGNFTWKFTVTDLAGATCGKTGSVKVASPLTPAATASPRQGPAPLTVSFTGSVKGGTAPYTYAWDFGDGEVSSSQSPAHTFAAAGAYPALFTVTDSKSQSASAMAPVYVGVPIPPGVSSVTSLSNPFRLKVVGADFQSGCAVTLDGAPVPSVTVVSPEKLMLKGGSALKAMVPRNVPVCLTVTNPDGGTSGCYTYIR